MERVFATPKPAVKPHTGFLVCHVHDLQHYSKESTEESKLQDSKELLRY